VFLRFVLLYKFISWWTDDREVNVVVVLRQALLRDNGYMRVQMYSQCETNNIIEGPVEYCD
jgi:hypothetical protein